MKSKPITLGPDQTRAIDAQIGQAGTLTTVLKVLIGISFVALIGSTVDDQVHNYSTSWQTIWSICAGVIIAVWLVRLVIRSLARDKLWSAFATAVQDVSPKTLNELANHLPSNTLMVNKSVIIADSSSYQTRDSVVFDMHKTTVSTTQLEITYTISAGPITAILSDPLELSIKLRVFTFRMPQYMPHIFISSRQRSRYRPSSRNMGLIDEKLPRNLKFQELEGDFNQYFTVYSADKSAVDILRILSPDVMIELRDNGVNFDIEIIDDRLYFYIEPSTYSPPQLEAVLGQIGQLIDSFAGEVARGLYSDEPIGSYIPVRRAAFYSSVIAARFSLVVGGYLAYVILAVSIGEAIAFLYTGEFSVF